MEGRYDVTLPDGRQVREWFAGYVEHDTGALIETSSKLEWLDSGEELTNEEINSEVADGYFLHEYVADFGEFTFEDWR